MAWTSPTPGSCSPPSASKASGQSNLGFLVSNEANCSLWNEDLFRKTWVFLISAYSPDTVAPVANGQEPVTPLRLPFHYPLYAARVVFFFTIFRNVPIYPPPQVVQVETTPGSVSPTRNDISSSGREQNFEQFSVFLILSFFFFTSFQMTMTKDAKVFPSLQSPSVTPCEHHLGIVTDYNNMNYINIIYVAFVHTPLTL